MRVLLIAPNYDAKSPGESWSTYKWVQGMSEKFDTTVLTQHPRGWDPSSSPTAAKQIVNWDEPKLPGMSGRIAWELKPAYVWFYFRARRWIKQARKRGERFDLIHQINPLALRYPSPARGWDVPYLVGPLAGSLETPRALKTSTPEKQWYRKLRALDSLRLRYDPWLRRTYSEAAAVVGVAPYVRELLRQAPPSRFEIMAETGVEKVAPKAKSPPLAGNALRLLFVGRLIRTKGILEAIESVARARAHCALTFDIVGTGDLAEECAGLVSRLGLADIVTLHGRRPQSEVFDWYERNDVFLFPSYREPSGNVVFEAMSRGLPVITTSIGGPGYVVTDSCGYRVVPDSRESFIAGLSAAIVQLAQTPDRFATMSEAALARMRELALWPAKLSAMQKLYQELGNRR